MLAGIERATWEKTMRWIDANGVSLRCELTGEGAQTVLLVHELGGTLGSWDAALPAFRKHFRTLRYDQRGCGLSEKVNGPITLEEQIADMAALLDTLGIREPCHVIGSALGSGVAAAFASRHPRRVARLVLQSLVTKSNPRFHEQMLERCERVVREGMRAESSTSLNRSYPEVLRTDRERFEQYRLRWIANDPRGFSAMNRMLIAMDLDEELGRIACPTLLIGCRHDPLRTPEMVKALAKLIPGARYVDADSGHFMHVQSPELFAELAVPFLLG